MRPSSYGQLKQVPPSILPTICSFCVGACVGTSDHNWQIWWTFLQWATIVFVLMSLMINPIHITNILKVKKLKILSLSSCANISNISTNFLIIVFLFTHYNIFIIRTTGRKLFPNLKKSVVVAYQNGFWTVPIWGVLLSFRNDCLSNNNVWLCLTFYRERCQTITTASRL